MRVSRDSFFIRKDHEFYDSALPAFIGTKAVAVYEVLQRFVWRSDDSGRRELRKLYKKGYLACRVLQKKLARLVDISPRHLRRQLERLEAFGWIVKEDLGSQKGGSLVYMLGVEDEDGRQHYFADAFVKAAWSLLCDYSEEECMQPYELDVEERLELLDANITYLCSAAETRAVESGARGALRGVGHTVPPGRTSGPRGLAIGCGGVGLPSSGGRTSGLTRRRELEEENWKNRKGKKNSAHSGRSEDTSSALEPGPAPTLKGAKTVRTAEQLLANVSDEGLSDKRTVRSDPTREHLQGLIDAQKARSEKEATERHDQAERRERNQKNLAGSGSKQKGAVPRLQKHWKQLIAENHPDAKVVDWGGKEAGQVKWLAEQYGEDVVREALSYLVERWNRLAQRFKRQSPMPSLGLLRACHDQIVNKALMWGKCRDALLAWERLDKNDPNAYTKAREVHAEFGSEKEAKALAEQYGL